MTAHWEKGDSHVVLVVEGVSTRCAEFKKALEISMEGNILIDVTRMDALDSESVKYLDEFAKKHTSKKYSMVLASPLKKLGFKSLEVVPSVAEARDLIFLEIAERELGLF